MFNEVVDGMESIYNELVRFGVTPTTKTAAGIIGGINKLYQTTNNGWDITEIPNSGTLRNLACAAGHDLSTAKFFIHATSLSTSGYAGRDCPSNSFSGTGYPSVSYDATSTVYSVGGTSAHGPGNDSYCNASIGYKLFVALKRTQL